MADTEAQFLAIQPASQRPHCLRHRVEGEHVMYESASCQAVCFFCVLFFLRRFRGRRLREHDGGG